MMRLGVLVLAFVVAAFSAPATRASTYEVWVIDQANVPDGGDRLYIYTPGSWSEPRETYYLWELAQGVGDGAGTRPHLLTFNSSHSHAILANVASGHVYIIRAADRTVVASIDVGEQAHGALASPDDKQILVSNQNGKKLARIHADFATESFRYDASEDLNLGALENPNQPDNAPICPMMYIGGGSKVYVTVRGGGLYVVDTMSSPMSVLKEYPKDQVAAAGCGGIEHAGVVYVNSGSPTDGHIYLFDAKTDALLKTIPTAEYGSDAHGMALLGGRYLWMGHRGNGDNIVVLDTTTQEIVGQIADVGAAPDLLDVSPGGELVFATLRGPSALTGGPSAIGVTPGVSILFVDEGGRTGKRVGFIAIGDQGGTSKADPHGIAVRRLAQ